MARLITRKRGVMPRQLLSEDINGLHQHNIKRLGQVQKLKPDLLKNEQANQLFALSQKTLDALNKEESIAEKYCRAANQDKYNLWQGFKDFPGTGLALLKISYEWDSYLKEKDIQNHDELWLLCHSLYFISYTLYPKDIDQEQIACTYSTLNSRHLIKENSQYLSNKIIEKIRKYLSQSNITLPVPEMDHRKVAALVTQFNEALAYSDEGKTDDEIAGMITNIDVYLKTNIPQLKEIEEGRNTTLPEFTVEKIANNDDSKLQYDNTGIPAIRLVPVYRCLQKTIGHLDLKNLEERLNNKRNQLNKAIARRKGEAARAAEERLLDALIEEYLNAKHAVDDNEKNVSILNKADHHEAIHQNEAGSAQTPVLSNGRPWKRIFRNHFNIKKQKTNNEKQTNNVTTIQLTEAKHRLALAGNKIEEYVNQLSTRLNNIEERIRQRIIQLNNISEQIISPLSAFVDQEFRWTDEDRGNIQFIQDRFNNKIKNNNNQIPQALFNQQKIDEQITQCNQLLADVNTKINTIQETLKQVDRQSKLRQHLVDIFVKQNNIYLATRHKRFWWRDFFGLSDRKRREQYIDSLNDALLQYAKNGGADILRKQIAYGKKHFGGHVLVNLLLNPLEEEINSFELRTLQSFAEQEITEQEKALDADILTKENQAYQRHHSPRYWFSFFRSQIQMAACLKKDVVTPHGVNHFVTEHKQKHHRDLEFAPLLQVFSSSPA